MLHHPRLAMRSRRSVTAALATTLALLAGGAAQAAPAADGATVELDGTLVQIVVDRPGEEHAELETRAAVDVDGTVVSLPADLGDVAGATGDPVELLVETAGPIAEADVVAALADPAAGDATIVDVTPVAAAALDGAQAPETAAGVLGGHTLTVLPVYWSTKDSATTSSLASVATRTAQYWSEQSAGGIAITTSVRAWSKIADPGSCDEDVLRARALAANGITSLGPNDHVLVYFPTRPDCGGWAGLASIGGNTIWVNGYALEDVFTHELGHNLGLGHANTAACYSASAQVALLLPVTSCHRQEYGDRADVMGIATSAPSGNLTTAFADFLGLATVVRPDPAAVTNVTLQPLSAVTGTRAIAIPVSGGVVYIDYRPAAGRDTRVRAWAGVQAHLRTVSGNYPTTYLLDMTPEAPGEFGSAALPVGASWQVPGTSQVVVVNGAGATAQLTVAPANRLVEAYVRQVYRDLFEREPDAGGLASWVRALNAGTPRSAVAASITSSTEYRSRLIQGVYRDYLGRAADRGGLDFWLGQLAAGRTVQDIEAGFLASAEMHAQAGGTDAGWVRELYRLVLGRTPSSSEVGYWVGVSAAQGRGRVALGFLLSTEHLRTVVDGYYQHLLGRGIDPSGAQAWVAAIQRGARVEEIIAGIVSSAEYVARATRT